jgi:hypothetical protein
LAQLQAMIVGPVGRSIPWCIPWCLPVHSGGRRGGVQVRTGALRRAQRRRRGDASAHLCDPPRGSHGRVGPAAARWRAHWPDFNRDCAVEAPVRTGALRRAQRRRSTAHRCAPARAAEARAQRVREHVPRFGSCTWPTACFGSAAGNERWTPWRKHPLVYPGAPVRTGALLRAPRRRVSAHWCAPARAVEAPRRRQCEPMRILLSPAPARSGLGSDSPVEHQQD